MKNFLSRFLSVKPIFSVVPKTEAEIITDNAVIYERYKDKVRELQPDTLHEVMEYINTAFDALPLPVSFVPRLVSCADMRKGIETTYQLNVSALHNESILLPGQLNLKFRAVHDWIHYKYKFGCDYRGELETYLVQSEGLSNEAKQVLYSEIVLQACYYLHYGVFPRQKVVLTEIPNPNK